MARPRSLLALVLVALVAPGCVNLDPKTGETLPRKGQRYRFEQVAKKAELLEAGMSRFQVLLLLGSPAEHSANGDVWTYLPDRTAYIVPARALRLEFEGDELVKHGFRPMVFDAAL